METRDDAVAYLSDRNVHAAKRDWVLGETVVVASGALTDPKTSITVYERCVYIVPDCDGWRVERLGPVRDAEPRSEKTLQAACDAALELLTIDERLHGEGGAT